MTWATHSHLLVVDDDVAIRQAITRRLNAAGYCVLQAADADDAMRILETRDDIDLICSDIEMPGSINGVDLSAVVHARWPLIKIVLMSGSTHLREGSIPGVFVEKKNGLDKICTAVGELMRSDPRLCFLSLQSAA